MKSIQMLLVVCVAITSWCIGSIEASSSSGIDRTSRSCVKLDACRCQFDDDKSVVNLWPLGHRDVTPLFLDHSTSDGFRYSYNPCYPFHQGRCRNSTICKTKVTNEVIAQVSSTDSDSNFFTFDGTHVGLGYVFQRGGRKILSQVTFACDPSRSLPLFSQAKHVDGVIDHYYFQVISRCACPNAC